MHLKKYYKMIFWQKYLSYQNIAIVSQTIYNTKWAPTCVSCELSSCTCPEISPLEDEVVRSQPDGFSAVIGQHRFEKLVLSVRIDFCEVTAEGTTDTL